MQHTLRNLCLLLVMLGLGATAAAQTVGFTNTHSFASETSGSIAVEITWTNLNVGTVSFSIVSGSTAVVTTDHTFDAAAASITFSSVSAGGTQNIVVPIVNNTVAQGTRTLVLEISVSGIGNALGTNRRHTIYIADNDQTVPTATNTIQLSKTGGWAIPTGSGDGAEIVAYHPGTQRLVVLSTSDKQIYTLNMSNPASPTLDQTIDLSGAGVTTGINSCAISGNLLAVAVEGATSAQANGRVRFYDMTNIASGLRNEVTVGAMPDMLTFTPDGTKLLVANEGEANNYSAGNTDPEGTVSIIPIPADITTLMQSQVVTYNLNTLNGQEVALRAAGVRITSPVAGTTVAQNLEPEYIAVSADNRYAYVTLQDNNALVTIDLQSFPTVSANISSFGLIPYNTGTNSIDPSNIAGMPSYRPFSSPLLFGCPQPDAIGTFVDGGTSYVVTANEGDARSYEETRYASLPAASRVRQSLSPDSAALVQTSVLGRINIINTDLDTDANGQADRIVMFGSRSFSIYSVNNMTGAATRVWDSEDDFERITLADPTFGALFNCSNSNNTLKDRSDDKGPEPEGLTIATLAGRRYAFITLERVGGIMTYDITNAAAPVFTNYVNSRTTAMVGGDRGPEGVTFIPAAQSPSGAPLVVTGNETSRTVAIYTVSGTVSNEADRADAATNLRISVSPNPAKDVAEVRVRGAQPGLVEVELIDLTGRAHLGQISSVSADGEATVLLPVASVAAGLYVVNARQRGATVSARLMVGR